MTCSLLLALLAGPALAFQSNAEHQRDAKRFHRYGAPPAAISENAQSKLAVTSFNARHGGLGLQGLAAGRRPAGGADPARAGAGFLAEMQKELGLDPSTLTLANRSNGNGLHHLLYRQTYKGLPVEFASVKIHLADDGSVIGYDSTYQDLAGFDAAPRVASPQAAAVVRADAGLSGSSLDSRGRLVILPADGGDPARLAWKFTAKTGTGLWRYYVDAKSGQLLFRYDDRRQFASCVTSGTVSGMVYDIDPAKTPGPVLRPINNAAVYIKDGTTWAATGGDPGGGVQYLGPAGAYCSGQNGKIFTQLQGPYVSVSSFRGPSAHFDNGQGVWLTQATPISSPHPYAGDSVYIATISLASITGPPGYGNPVKFAPVFTTLQVGSMETGTFGEADDIAQDDQVAVLDSTGHVVGSFLGNYSAAPYSLPLVGAAVPGQVMRIQLKSTPGGGGIGYDVSLSSYLVLSNPSVNANNNDVVWFPTMTPTGLRSEISLMYHINRMHDFFMGTVDKSSASLLGSVDAIAFAGPGLTNAFYDPDFNNIWFGDISGVTPGDSFTDDATVPHHEYTHFMVAQIWPIVNFGQAGAISEANADYWSASSLNDSSIGEGVNGEFGNTGALRELSCPDKTTCRVLSQNSWQGEIHSDSIFLSQALWDIRKNRIALQGATAGPDIYTDALGSIDGAGQTLQYTEGQACADGLVFQALLFFPESFQEFLNALLAVDAAGTVHACGVGACGGDPHSCVQATINAAFAAHGLAPVGGTNDPYDTVTSHDDGFQTAVDISTLGAVTATIFPAADVDFYTFGAGPGLVSATLDLPASQSFPSVQEAYMMTLYDAGHNQLAQAAPPFDGGNNTTVDGVCQNNDCTTSVKRVTLNYNNATGQQLFLEVSGGGPTTNGPSISGVNSTLPYTLKTAFSPSGALESSVVSAKFDGDTFDFTVQTATFVVTQPYHFAYAQLRDHDLVPLQNTLTHFPAQAGDFLVMLSSQNGGGQITGQLQLQKGFAARFPSVGTIHVEIFGVAEPTPPYTIFSSTVSLGVSQPLNLTTDTTAVTAWNNVFNPRLGQKATVKWDMLTAGHVRIRLFTLNGTFITTLVDDDYPPGKGAVDWNGLTKVGTQVASGIYLLRVEAPGLNTTKKIAVVK